MTRDKLSRANKLQMLIADKKKMISNMQDDTYTVKITAYGSNSDKYAQDCICAGDELHTIILDYYKKQLETLCQEFADL